MNYTKIFILILFVSILAACNKKNTESPKQLEVNKVTLDTLRLLPPENLKSPIPLTSKAKAAVQDWSFYKELTTAINNIDAKTLYELREKLEGFNTIYEVSEEATEAEVSVTPKEVETNAINARLLAVKTRIDALQNEADLNNPSASQLSIKIGELINAYQDLNLQLNEVYNTSVKDLLEEIKAENEKDQMDDNQTVIINAPSEKK
ncbi:hypothetical protein [Dokdonia sp. Hel_I_53]|uniref:hypothetical protein n=1 Tax=Dokdonia sp. Hel_I_53 TaxID=1566287 RepID=UPI00119AA3A4|nr:hypothetical protein [Dokdonia sp. Hel_I_53]TVZ52726.1 hypothetical protein OD90_1910 [Dokdonia sp. Hel_I_53]